MTVGCVSRVIALSPYIPLSRSQARHRRRVATNARLPRQAVVEEAGREERRYCGRRALVSLCTIAFGGALLDRTAAAETSEAITISVDDVIPTTAASAVEAAASVVASTPPPPPRRPSACATGTSCVSTSSFRSPANFLPPWDYGPTESDSDAFAKLTSVLREKPGSIITTADEKTEPLPEGYLAASLAYSDGMDDVEFFFLLDGSKTVLFRSQSRVNRASPPGCFTPGCINGPRNRGRLESLQRELGWLPLETDEEKKWVPLLLH